VDSISSWFSRSISLSLSNGINGSAATDLVGSNCWFFDDFIGWIGREIYHFARVKLNSEGGRFFWVIFGGISQKPCAEGHFAHPPGGALAFVWAGLQK